MSKKEKYDIVAANYIANYFSFFMGWGVTTHSAAGIIVKYTEFLYCRHWDKGLEKISLMEAATRLISQSPSVEIGIMKNSLNVYLFYKSQCLVTFEKMNEWFRQQSLPFRTAIFKEELEQLAIIFHVSNKAHTSFIKTLTPVDPENRGSAFITWWDKRLVATGVVVETQEKTGVVVPKVYKTGATKRVSKKAGETYSFG
jgi:hypothetical protein